MGLAESLDMLCANAATGCWFSFCGEVCSDDRLARMQALQSGQQEEHYVVHQLWNISRDDLWNTRAPSDTITRCGRQRALAWGPEALPGVGAATATGMATRMQWPGV